VNKRVFEILLSPDDGTPIRENLKSDGGNSYEMTDSGVLLLAPKKRRLSDAVYSSPMFEKWDVIVEERIKYYTKKQSIAGLIANQSYQSIRRFNHRSSGEWIVDIGCGDGAQAANLVDRSTYIGLDRNLKRLEILKQRYPEATAIYGDASRLPFKSGTLKSVFSSNTFEHIWDLRDAMLELYRCLTSDGEMIIVIPTEGGLWNIGRELISKPHFQKKHRNIDFEFISHVEHCNEARQIIRTFDTLFDVRKRYWPTGVPSVMLNVYVELHCQKKENQDLVAEERFR
jgi:ubiquinone/menaquinone biosynthesis C-methylase UbiE